MGTDIPIHCACNTLRGVARNLSKDAGNRCICYCDDCQSFAFWLEREREVLDACGGTDIFQTSQARVEFTHGKEHLACLRLTPKGLLRWYASCCSTPIANTPVAAGVPFVGILARGMDHTAPGQSLDEVLGPVRARVNARFAQGDRSRLAAHGNTHDRAPLAMILRLLGMVAGARLRGDHRRSPFFDSSTGACFATPRILSAEELSAVVARRDSA